MKPLTSQQQQQARYSGEALARIDDLEKSDDFSWFLEILKRKSDDLAQQILHSDEDTLSDQGRRDMRHHRNGILEALSALAEAKTSHLRIMKDLGVAPAELTPQGG